MDKVNLQTKVQQLEVELEGIKAVLAGEPDLAVDEKNWKRVEPAVRQVRKAIFKKRYGEG